MLWFKESCNLIGPDAFELNQNKNQVFSEMWFLYKVRGPLVTSNLTKKRAQERLSQNPKNLILDL